jgi:hypothetical protein
VGHLLHAGRKEKCVEGFGGENIRLTKFGIKMISLEETLKLHLLISCSLQEVVGRDSVVGTATSYGLEGPGIESRWGGKILRTLPDQPWGPPSLLYNGYRVSFLRLK